MIFKLFNYEIVVRKNFSTNITEQTPMNVPKEFVLEYPMEKRISAMVREDGFIQYIFRDLDVALLTYGDYAIQLFGDVMDSLTKIRNKLKAKGATEEQLAIFDNKVHGCFHSLCFLLEARDRDTLDKIKDFDIKNYHG